MGSLLLWEAHRGLFTEKVQRVVVQLTYLDRLTPRWNTPVPKVMSWAHSFNWFSRLLLGHIICSIWNPPPICIADVIFSLIISLTSSGQFVTVIGPPRFIYRQGSEGCGWSIQNRLKPRWALVSLRVLCWAQSYFWFSPLLWVISLAHLESTTNSMLMTHSFSFHSFLHMVGLPQLNKSQTWVDVFWHCMSGSVLMVLPWTRISQRLSWLSYSISVAVHYLHTLLLTLLAPPFRSLTKLKP